MRKQRVLTGHLRKADDAAGDARTGVASGLAELVSALSQVVGVCVHHQRSPHYAVRTGQRNRRVRNADLWTNPNCSEIVTQFSV